MSTSAVQTLIVQRFTNLYGAPEATDAKAYVGEYRKALEGTDSSILEEAADRIVKQHKYRNWPTPGECVDMVNVVAERRARERENLNTRKTAEPFPKPTAEERARVDALLAETRAKLKAIDDKRPAPVLPRVDRDAWEARFGRGSNQ